MIGNKFNNKLGLDFKTIRPESYMDVQSLNHFNYGIWREGKFYNVSTKKEVEDIVGYRKLQRIGKDLFDHFKLVGDIQTSNLAYIKIRDTETKYLANNFANNPTFKNFFSLNLNRLLKFYTSYGTDPARAIVISIYVILLFGLFYFFFPSDWDMTSKPKLIQNFKDFIQKNDKGYLKPFLALIAGLFVSFINAFMLSMNAYTTLGFGSIPTKGVARYVCIIEGFIGWFLLSLFTVALLNQSQF
jgi:hypothetical protein